MPLPLQSLKILQDNSIYCLSHNFTPIPLQFKKRDPKHHQTDQSTPSMLSVVCKTENGAKSRGRNVRIGFLTKVFSQKSKIRRSIQIGFLRKVKTDREAKLKENLNYINGVHKNEKLIL